MNIEIMSKIPFLCCSTALFGLRTFASIQRGRGCYFSYFSSGIKQTYEVGLAHRFRRLFIFLSGASNGKESDGREEEGRSKLQDVVTCENDNEVNKNANASVISENAILELHFYGIVDVQKPDLLGIEVFPEIFDKLPPKCPGCGAVLQSDSEKKPGYIPRNRNPNLSQKSEEDRFRPETICARCFGIKHYNKDYPPVVSPETITNFLMHISRRKALILYIVDVMDIPGSFIPDIMKIVGETKHMILVCNKIDRLAVDGHPRLQMDRIKGLIFNEARNFGLENVSVKDVCAISARTGFGVQELVRKIIQYWQKNSDIYIVGSNNSGKTTFFNLLADLFGASRHAEDMLQRGTISHSPGTTLSLLRYPITYHRFLRLQDRLQQGYSEERSKEKSKEIELDRGIVDRQMTKYKEDRMQELNNSEPTIMAPYRPQFVTRQKEDNIRWLYDTPGLYSKNQINHLLTNHELKLLSPALWFVPRTVILKPGQVLFLGGLARLDYLNVSRLSRNDCEIREDVPKASQSVFFTVFASPNLPIHVTSLERADLVYDKHVGDEFFKLPYGGKERMEKFPALSGRVMEITGVDWKRSAADVIFSNVGWVAVTAGSGSLVTIKAYTPSKTGLYLRDPPLLPTSVRQRGRRGVPYLGHINHSMYQGTRKRSPSLLKYLVEKNNGTAQWMKVAEKKRRQQRLTLKFEKTRWNSQKKIGYSARSNPTRYLADYEDHIGYPELENEKGRRDDKNIAANGHERLE